MQYQPRVAQKLARIIQARAIPNALLFTGASNTAKKEAAFLFARGLNCRNSKTFGCQTCPVCTKIDADSHPDMLVTEPETGKKNITIAQIRELTRRLQARPNEAQYRMVLINDAQTMNTQAQNALLKILEEPPAKTFFILIAPDVSTVLPTILSRCRQIYFQTASTLDIEKQLRDIYGLSEEQSRIAAGTFEQDLDAALKFSGHSEDQVNTEWQKIRLWLFKNLCCLVENKKEDSLARSLYFSAALVRYQEQMPLVIQIIRTFFRDLMIFRFSPEKIVNLDFSATFTDISQKIPNHFFAEWTREWIKTEKRIESNSSARLALDRFFTRLAATRGHA